MTWDNSAITITTFLPLLGALVIVLVPKDKDRLIRGLGIVFTAAALILAVVIAANFDYDAGGAIQDSTYYVNREWIPSLGVAYTSRTPSPSRSPTSASWTNVFCSASSFATATLPSAPGRSVATTPWSWVTTASAGRPSP